ncbi:hypothetical protein O6H91_14G061200 [Diphasiastrum complanatum]|uniref:Uncharacterized protein n=1 Tax=Diphasiastrum complanatum TaxID=34168 RepID=A0ACC2BQ39_DIPCM|nr:hypothetical protein O6H91_14G061200 [Diphasiastrum complanatum]
MASIGAVVLYSLAAMCSIQGVCCSRALIHFQRHSPVLRIESSPAFTGRIREFFSIKLITETRWGSGNTRKNALQFSPFRFLKRSYTPPPGPSHGGNNNAQQVGPLNESERLMP